MGQTVILLTASLLAQAGNGQIAFDNSAGDGRSCGCQSAVGPGPSPGLFGFGLFSRFRPAERVDDVNQPSDRFQPSERFQSVSDDQFVNEPRPGILGRIASRFGNLFGRSSNEGAQVEFSGPADATAGVAVSAPAVATTLNEPPLGDGKVMQVGFNPAPAPAATTFAPTTNNSVILARNVNRVGHEDDYSWITGQLGQANGQWVIHYATPETQDRFHGQLVLVKGDMSNFHVGDLVSVQGGLMAQNGRVLAAYQVHNITLIERK